MRCGRLLESTWYSKYYLLYVKFPPRSLCVLRKWNKTIRKSEHMSDDARKLWVRERGGWLLAYVCMCIEARRKNYTLNQNYQISSDQFRVGLNALREWHDSIVYKIKKTKRIIELFLSFVSKFIAFLKLNSLKRIFRYSSVGLTLKTWIDWEFSKQLETKNQSGKSERER